LCRSTYPTGSAFHADQLTVTFASVCSPVARFCRSDHGASSIGVPDLGFRCDEQSARSDQLGSCYELRRRTSTLCIRSVAVYRLRRDILPLPHFLRLLG